MPRLMNPAVLDEEIFNRLMFNALHYRGLGRKVKAVLERPLFPRFI